MIGFGELRKKSVEWQTEISTVEKLYARDWLIRGVFERESLRTALVLRGESAFASAYFRDYPRVEDLDFVRRAVLDDAGLARELEPAVEDAARASGLQFRMNAFEPTQARIEFTGPLGRRSAAQPLIVLRFVTVPLRIEPSTVPLIHLFSDSLETSVHAVSPTELAAERVVLYARSPRARDLYDLWFLLTHTETRLDPAVTLALAGQIAQEKKVVLRRELDSKYASILERGWDKSLQGIRARPSFSLVHAEIAAQLARWGV